MSGRESNSNIFKLKIIKTASKINQNRLTKHDKSARVTSCFEQMTYWNYDRAPSQADAWQQALEWTKVADVLHSD